MEEFVLKNYQALWWFWSLPIIVLIGVYGFYRKGAALRRLAEADLLAGLNPDISRARQITRFVLLVLAAGAIIMALTQPAWNPRTRKVHHRGRDIAIVLDVSRSMLAEDLAPNRLERSKIWINDLLDTLQGDRVGLIVFAGEAVVKCPLTTDYGFVRTILTEVGPGSVSTGGTLIGDAIRRTLGEIYDRSEKQYKDIILITDGEDHDSFPVEAARQAGDKGVRIFAVGIGDEVDGSLIPIVNRQTGQKEYLKYHGKLVRTKLNNKALREIVSASAGGTYINVATANFDLADLYRKQISVAGKRDLEAQTTVEYDQRFQVFLALALMLLVVEVIIGERKKL